MKKMISLLLVLVMVLSMIPMTATALVPPYPIEEFSIDIPAYIGATRLSFDQMRFCAQEYVVDSLGFCAIEGETDIVWTKNSLFGKRMEENETYQKGVVYYANFLVLNTNTYVNTFGYGAPPVITTLQSGSNGVIRSLIDAHTVMVYVEVTPVDPKLSIDITAPGIDALVAKDLSVSISGDYGNCEVDNVIWNEGSLFDTDVIKRKPWYRAKIQIKQNPDNPIPSYVPFEILGLEKCRYLIYGVKAEEEFWTIELEIDSCIYLDEITLGFDLAIGKKFNDIDYGVPIAAPYTASYYSVFYTLPEPTGKLTECSDTFAKEGENYCVRIYVAPKEGYLFDESVVYNWLGEKGVVTKTPSRGSSFHVIDVRFFSDDLDQAAFVKQPRYAGRGNNSNLENSTRISWKVNFTPVKLELSYNKGTETEPDYVTKELDSKATFTDLDTFEKKSVEYFITAYYGENGESSVRSELFTTQKPEGFILYGDSDGDEEVTSSDALFTLQVVVGKSILEEDRKINADVDGVDGITSTDALRILQKVVNLIDVFAVEK